MCGGLAEGLRGASHSAHSKLTVYHEVSGACNTARLGSWLEELDEIMNVFVTIRVKLGYHAPIIPGISR